MANFSRIFNSDLSVVRDLQTIAVINTVEIFIRNIFSGVASSVLHLPAHFLASLESSFSAIEIRTNKYIVNNIYKSNRTQNVERSLKC